MSGQRHWLVLPVPDSYARSTSAGHAWLRVNPENTGEYDTRFLKMRAAHIP